VADRAGGLVRAARGARRGDRAARAAAPRRCSERARVVPASLACQRGPLSTTSRCARRTVSGAMPAVTGVNVADALTTQGRLAGIVTAAVARVEAIVPLSVVETAMLPPVCPLTTTTTVAPAGLVVPVSVGATA